MTGDTVLDLFVQYSYWVVFVSIWLDNAGVPLPGELLLLAFGAMARAGHVDLAAGWLLAWAAAVGGDHTGYWLGRLGGGRLVHAYCRVTLGSGACVDRAVSFYRLRGPVALIGGRFVFGVRAFLAPLAGSTRMAYGRFLLFDALGALAWSSLFVLAGYALGWDVGGMQQGYRRLYRVTVALIGAGAAGYLIMKLARRRRHGRAVVPVAEASFAPQPPSR